MRRYMSDWRGLDLIYLNMACNISSHLSHKELCCLDILKHRYFCRDLSNYIIGSCRFKAGEGCIGD